MELEINSIKVTDFGKRHFEPKFGGTKIKDMSPEEFEVWVIAELENFNNNYQSDIDCILPGYADFCKLVCIRNTTSARTGSLPITIENYQYLRSGFYSRTTDELPVMDRWFELPLSAPTAKYLMIVLYSKEQILKELSESSYKDESLHFDADWGVVAILGQMHSGEEPMKPITMMRNALGISEGGSGVPLDRERYAKSVDFWSNNATVK
jgi:hypothetical protein